jgi:hypothetical protein
MSVVGKRIVAVKPLSEKLMKDEGWDYGEGVVLELEDGTLLYPSRDPEGNGPGVLFGKDKNGKNFMLAF